MTGKYLTNCQSRITFTVKGDMLVPGKVSLHHNHPVSIERASMYRKNIRLNGEAAEAAHIMLSVKPRTDLIRLALRGERIELPY